MGEGVIQSLRGKVLAVPPKQKWILNALPRIISNVYKNCRQICRMYNLQSDRTKDDHMYLVQAGETAWTPMNSNLHMQGIKVGNNSA